MMFGNRTSRDRRQASKDRESRRRRLTRLMSRAPHVETLEDRRLLAVYGGGGAITINDNTTAMPYPSALLVADAAVNASIVDVNITLTNLSHTSPDDIDILLVGPAGGAQNALIMSDAGNGDDIVNVTLTFDDEAGSTLPDSAQIVSGTFQPSNFGGTENLPGAAPPTAGSALSVFDGANFEGTWNLFVDDDAPLDVGSIASWSLDIQLGGAVTIDAGAGADDTTPDTFNVIRNGANLEVRVNGGLVFNEPFTGVTSLTVNGSTDDDTLTVDMSVADAIPSGGISFIGGEMAGDNDSLVITGYNLPTADGTADVTANHTGAEAGNVVLAGLGTVTFSQTEPLALSGTAADLVINLPAGPNTDVVLGNDTAANFPGNGLNVAGSSAIDASTFEYTVFANPANSLTVNLGAAGDTISLRAMDGAFAPAGAAPFVVNGGVGSDTFDIVGPGLGASLEANGQDGNDIFNIEGLPATSGLDIDGGDETPDGDGDVINMNAYVIDTVRHFLDTPSAGRFEYDADDTDDGGAAEVEVDYVGLEPIFDNGAVVNRVFSFGAGDDADVAILDDPTAGNNITRIQRPPMPNWSILPHRQAV